LKADFAANIVKEFDFVEPRLWKFNVFNADIFVEYSSFKMGNNIFQIDLIISFKL